MATIDLKRGKRKETPVSVITQWNTRDDQAALAFSKTRLGQHLPRKATGRIRDVWRVMVWDAGVWRIVSEHFTRNAAMKALTAVVKGLAESGKGQRCAM